MNIPETDLSIIIKTIESGPPDAALPSRLDDVILHQIVDALPAESRVLTVTLQAELLVDTCRASCRVQVFIGDPGTQLEFSGPPPPMSGVSTCLNVEPS